ncbi:hypothetical protein CEXT_240001 [Caerostris extrusa]|uniref:Uncharacterized protein n=1 Tax=Caerostris extrusa TaxID=172846 RepID=A0AAV4MLY6_CAEEX|nr:hypothetical protein CEXT_240001 [Caerostris extrusa]
MLIRWKQFQNRLLDVSGPFQVTISGRIVQLLAIDALKSDPRKKNRKFSIYTSATASIATKATNRNPVPRRSPNAVKYGIAASSGSNPHFHSQWTKQCAMYRRRATCRMAAIK